jgi:hypothetical protein
MKNSVLLSDYIDKLVDKLCRFDPSSGGMYLMTELLKFDVFVC